jgi:hypothetical protein
MEISNELAQQLDYCNHIFSDHCKLLKKELDDVPDDTKLTHLNRRLSAADEHVRNLFPEAWAHERTHLAYHESGHALVRMLLYPGIRALKYIDLTVQAESVAKFLQDRVRLGKVVYDDSYPHDKVKEMLVICAAVPASIIFCDCKLAESGGEADSSDFDSLFPQPNPDSDDLGKYVEVLGELYDVVSGLLQRYKPQLEAIARALLENKTLTYEQVVETLKKSGWKPEPPPDFLLQQIESIRALLVV